MIRTETRIYSILIFILIVVLIKNETAFKAAFLDVLEIASLQKNLKKVGTVSVDGTKSTPTRVNTCGFPPSGR